MGKDDLAEPSSLLHYAPVVVVVGGFVRLGYGYTEHLQLGFEPVSGLPPLSPGSGRFTSYKDYNHKESLL